jgi:ABC-type Fe3+ transport system substrate-binding protein
MRRILAFIAILAAVLALPFLLRPVRPAGETGADDVLVIVTPHNQAIRREFALGFSRWYRARTGRTVTIDWRMLGGTSEIAHYLEGAYVGAFRNFWTGRLGRAWNAEVQAGFQNGRLPADAALSARAAREAFLQSEVGCGIDLFFGGGTYDFERQAEAGRIVDSGMRQAHPEWFAAGAIPQSLDGGANWDPQGRWIGCVLSCYGIIYNRDALARLGLPPPEQWTDLADPRYAGQVALADPTKSGSVAEAFENIMQQRIRSRGSVPEGWLDGLRLMQSIGANARYFTDAAPKVPIDVANGDCAAGLCIDFYGRQQEEAVRRRGNSERVGVVLPEGGSAYSADSVALLRGAPHRKIAADFIEYALSMDGQKLWDFRIGAPGGPAQFALRRTPIRRDFYAHDEWRAWRSDPEVNPYAGGSEFMYHPEWTAGLFRELAFIVRVMDEDRHVELVGAWRAINAAPEPARSRALAVLRDMSAVTYDRAEGPIRRALESKDRVDEVRLARDLGEIFRRNYARAEAVARGE